MRFSPPTLIVLVAVFIAATHNQALFKLLSERLDALSWQGFGYAAFVGMLVTTLLSWLLLVVAQHFWLKPTLMLVLLVSAVLSYFTQSLGVLFDVDMIRNMAETVRDNNRAEAQELISWPLISHVLLWGVMPGIVVVLFPLASSGSWWRGGLRRLAYAVVLFAVTAALLLVNYKYATYFSRENRDVRNYVTPLFAFNSVYKYINSLRAQDKMQFVELGTDAKQHKTTPARTIGIMVVGETARADHFSLNGYGRDTNPLLAKEKITSFKQANACGTSTAFSVPCMFSFLGRENYSPEKAGAESNVLDVLQRAGVKVLWLDNNSSCKGVCERVENINLRGTPDEKHEFYSDGGYYDEAMLDYLADAVKSSQDVLIVLHTLGSHGPTYHKRFPAAFAQFKPYCQQDTPQACGDQEVINAYDNTLLYTDYVLERFITWLKQQTAQDDTFLLYASDHGESLGENGVYLHGLPYFIAPAAQTHIPMLLWLSDGYLQHSPTAWSTAQGKVDQPLSHDNLSHTLLGMFGVQTTLYQSQLDLLR